MSSPPLNCFLAAARTASLIASITNSRSMPCSWQSASMFCAMVVLINKTSRCSWLSSPFVLQQMAIKLFSFFGPSKLSFYVECGAELLADFGAIPMRHASRLINEHPNHRTIVGAGDFGVDQLDAVVNRGLLGKLANALLHRP